MHMEQVNLKEIKPVGVKQQQLFSDRVIFNILKSPKHMFLKKTHG